MSRYKFEFTHTPLMNTLHRLRIEKSKDLQIALENDLTDEINRDLIWRFEHERNVNIFIKGQQGAGKSTGAQAFKVIGDNFFKLPSDVDDILFTRRQFLQRFKGATTGQSFIIDEDFDYITKVGAARVRESIRLVEQTIRATQCNLISCAVSEAPHLYNYILEAFDIEYRYRLNRFLLLDSTSFGNYPVGIVLLDANTIPKKLGTEYQIKKNAFLAKVKLQSNQNVYEDLEGRARKLLDSLAGFKGRLSKGFMKVHCRKYNPELAETELDEITEVCLYLSALDKQKNPLLPAPNFASKKQ